MQEQAGVIRNTYEQIKEGIELRANLSTLRTILKENEQKHAFLYYLGQDYTVFVQLLQHEDPKVRKQVALVLGELGNEAVVEPLLRAYEREETLFIRSAYLAALKHYPLKAHLQMFKRRIEAISNTKFTLENKKHLTEELRELTELVVSIEGIKRHVYKETKAVSELILLTNRNYIDKIMEELQTVIEKKTFNAGIMVKTDSLEDILPLRYYDELLFVVKGMKTCPTNPEEAARKIAESELLSFLLERHTGESPFYFRIECKSRLPMDKKGIFIKRLSSELERLTERKLINSTSHYEIEIRLIENKTGSFNGLVKLYTLVDTRFSYRKEVIASSIRPQNAALCCLLAKDFCREDAKILDPCCGTGTMLIERHKYLKANTMYGLDLYGDAIEAAKKNTGLAHQIIHYINRDFFDFEHEYLFDEVISNLPTETEKKAASEIRIFYDRFLEKIGDHLTDDGVLILYSHNKELMERYYPKYGFIRVKVFEISKREGTYLYILKKQ